MKIVLCDEIKELGITEDQVRCMLRACDEHRREQYEPTYAEFRILLGRALELERKKQRLVQLWEVAFKKVS